MSKLELSAKDITVVLNGYKRPYALQEQYEAYKNQTIGTPRFMMWCNSVDEFSTNESATEIANEHVAAVSSKNLGVWARFSLALSAQTPLVCVVDDDSIPGPGWLQNCLETLNNHEKPAILTTRGVRIKNHNYPHPDSYEAKGWCSQNEEVEEVDFGGHCWFFPKDLLRLYWFSSPAFLPLNYGEDMHLSYAGWKMANVQTLVPPHPKNDKSIWGSIKASEYGEDENATSRDPGASQGMFDYWNWMIKEGYKIVDERGQDVEAV